MQAYMTTRSLIHLATIDYRPLLVEIELLELANAPRQLAFSDDMVYLTERA